MNELQENKATILQDPQYWRYGRLKNYQTTVKND